MASLPRCLDKQDLAARFGKAAPRYDRYAQLQQEVGRHLLGLLAQKNHPVALDLGCGTGFFLQDLQQFSNRLFALDLSLGMLRQTQGRDLGLPLVCGDAEALPFATASLDLVFSSLTLQWCASLPVALEELHRVVKPGGTVAFATLSEGSLWELRRAWQKVDSKAHVNHFMAASDLHALARDGGFEVLRWECRRHTLNYPEVRDVLMSLKGIGANQVHGERDDGLSGRERMDRLAEAYEEFRGATGALPVSYDVCYGVLSR